MNLTVYDYGTAYEHIHFDVTFSHWGYVMVELEGTLEEVPWKHAEKVEAVLELGGQLYSFDPDVTVLSDSADVLWGNEVHVRLFATHYEVIDAADHSTPRVGAD